MSSAVVQLMVAGNTALEWGTVSDLADVSLDKLRAGGGVGLRYLLSRRQDVTVRFDIAWGNGFGAYFDVLEAF